MNIAKLTDKERAQAKKALQERLTDAIDETPRGLTTGEINECILKTCAAVGLITMPKIK